MSIYASEFLKWLRIFGVTTGGGPAPTGALLAVNNLDDVLNSTTAIENIGLGRPGILVLTDADFAGGGGTYVLTNPPPIYVSMSATSPGRVLQLPPQNEAKSLQGSEAIRIITGGAQEININNGAGTLIFQAAADSAWDAIPNNRTTIAGAWEFLGVVMTINGNKTGNVLLTSDPHTLYVSNSGSDLGGDGSQLFPYATLSHALAVATPSPTSPYEIVMLRGIYTETNLTLKANVYINGTYSTLNVSGTISLDVDWASGGYLYIQNFENLILPSVVNLDFNAVFAPFALFSFANNIINSNTTMNVTGGTANGAIVLISNNFGFSNEISYNITNCYGAINGGACGDIHVINTSDTAGGNFSVVGMTEIGNFTATTSSTSGLTVFHEASKVIGDTLYQTTGPGNLIAQEKGITHLGGLTLDNGLGGGTVQFSAANLTALPTLLNGATYQPDSISDAMRANKYYTPSNYTPLPGPPGEWVADSVTGNLAGIDAALASGGSIPPAYAETYFQDNAMPTTFTGADTPTKVLATAYNTGEMDGFTQVNGTFTYTGLPTRIIQLTAMLTATYAGTVQNTSFFITKNGTPIAKSKQKALIGIVTPAPEPLPVQVTTSAITGDLFELWVENNDNTNAITVIDLNFGIQGITGNATSAGIPPSYAEMFFQDNTTPTVIATDNVPVKINATYSADMLKDFTHANGTLTYNNALAKVFVVDADLTATYPGTAQNTSFFITKNGSVIAKSKQSTFIGPISPANVANPCHAVIGLSLGDTIEVWVENNDNANDVIVTDFNLFINSIDATGTSPNIAQIAQLIWVNDISGNDTNNGSVDSPLKSYEAARLLAISRGASINEVFLILFVGTLNITGNMTISPYVNVSGFSRYSEDISISGNVVLDPTWATANAPYTTVQNMNIACSAFDLNYGTPFNPTEQSYLRFESCSLQVGGITITGSGTAPSGFCENIVFNNCNTDGTPPYGPTITAHNVNLYLFNTSIPSDISIDTTTSDANAYCVISSPQSNTGNMSFSTPVGGKLEVHMSACASYGKTLTMNNAPFVFMDVASYGYGLVLTGTATLAQLRQTSQGDGLLANVNFTPSAYTPAAGTLFAANTLTGNLKGIDNAIAALGGVVPSQMIFVDGINGNDSNTGSISSPLLTYEAARLLAVSRNPQYGSAQVIIIMSTISIAGDMTISPFVSVMGMNKYSTIIGVSGAIVLDAAWGSTAFGEAQVSSLQLIANHIDLTFVTYTDEAIVRFEDCIIQLIDAGSTATFTGSNGSGNTNCETVIFNNCSLDLQIGISEPQFISDNVNLFLFNTSVSNTANGVVASVTSATVAATLLIQNAIANVTNITLNATSTGTLATQISGCNTASSTLTVNGTANSVTIDADSYKFLNFVFSGGASFSNINGSSPLVIYIDQLNGSDNNSGSVNYPMQNYESARLAAIARLGANLQALGCVIMVVGNINITGDMTLTPGICIDSTSPYSSGFEVNGNVVLDPSWGTNFSYVQIRNVYIYLGGGNYNFIFPAIDPSGSSFLKFVNCQFNTGGFITITGFGASGQTENVTFENCTVDFLNYTPGFTVENVNLYLINTDLTVSDITMTASTANANNYVLAINDARFYTGNIDVITNNTSTLTTYINACNTMSKTLTINGVNNTVNVDSTSYMFTLALAGGATLANLTLPTLTDGMTNANYTPTHYTPASGTAFKANSLTGNLKGIDNALPQTALNGITFGSSVGVSAISIIRSHEMKVGNMVTGSVVFSFTASAALVTINVNKSFGSTFSTSSNQAIGSGICAKTPVTAIGDASVQIVQASFLTAQLQFVMNTNGSVDYIAEINFTYEVT